MYIVTQNLRDEFIGGLRYRYARDLKNKEIAEKGHIMFAATHLYAFGTPFANQGKTRQPRYSSHDISKLTTVLTPFVNMVWNYFRSPAPSTQADFDVIHKRMCDEFLSNISADGKYTHTYGNSQKMVNVLFKYLACFKDSPKYAEWFRYCHMALDGYTYSGGYRLPFYSKVVYSAIHGHKAPKLVAWSQIKTYSYYKNIADDIISYVNSHPKTYNDYLGICAHFPILSTIPKLPPQDDYVLTPFEAEFFIWVISQACMEKHPTGGYVYPNSLVATIMRLL